MSKCDLKWRKPVCESVIASDAAAEVDGGTGAKQSPKNPRQRERTVSRFTGLLARYTETLPPERVKSAKTRASIAFADGKLVHKYATSKLVLSDKIKLTAALDAANRPDLLRVKTTTEPAWSDIKPGIT